MPVVRELVNRISFKMNPGDKENVEKSFGKIKKLALGVGAAISGASIKNIIDIEKSEAQIQFFTNSREEFEKMLKIKNDLAKSELISEKEAANAAALFSQFNIDTSDLQQAVPFLKLLAEGRPDKSFGEIAQDFAEAMRSGDPDQWAKLGVISKDIAEQYKIADVNMKELYKTQENLFQAMLEGWTNNKGKLEENADVMENKIITQWRALKSTISDIFTGIGKIIESPIAGILKGINKGAELFKNIFTEEGREGLKDKIKGKWEDLKGSPDEGMPFLGSYRKVYMGEGGPNAAELFNKISTIFSMFAEKRDEIARNAVEWGKDVDKKMIGQTAKVTGEVTHRFVGLSDMAEQLLSGLKVEISKAFDSMTSDIANQNGRAVEFNG